VKLAHRLIAEIFSGRFADWWDLKSEDCNHCYAKPYYSGHVGTNGDSNFPTYNSQIHFALSDHIYKRSPLFYCLQIATVSPHHRFWLYRRYMPFGALK
jgi:hypothetical protein